MTDKHSPGPWKVHPRGRSAPGYDVSDRIISDTWTGRSIYTNGVSDADAALIAAAPELLEALDALVSQSNDACGVISEFVAMPVKSLSDKLPTTVARLKLRIDQARKALAKAERRS